ncbi:MAG: serine protease [Candidatus Uhrbacteria bacterium]|nr:serine protease [Candidatus Uhrbacteria bacterium]
MKSYVRSLWALLLVACLWALPVQAQTVDPVAEAKKAVVWVTCGESQGSGTVINGNDGYVLTNGHVALDIETGAVKAPCEIAFADLAGRPQIFYHASVVHSVFNNRLSQDFAILRIELPSDQAELPKPYPSVTTNEFTSRGEAVHIYGFSGGRDRLVTHSGMILDYVAGFIQTNAEVNPGDSGGAGFDDKGRLIGIPTRIVTLTDPQGNQTVYYELIDIRAVMNWLDTFGFNEHDRFFTHFDFERYHRNAIFITQDNLGCAALGRTPAVSSVYCIMADGTRFAFPNDLTFFSWFPDFSDIRLYNATNLASYRLTRNATFKPGTLVKLRTAPQVYVVVDGFGTLRWIPSEERVVELWGPAWAGLVFDVPDEFWTNYTVGQPLEG